MRLEQLEYLEAVATQGSLRRASEHVHLTQQALSEALRKLERELGVPLLERQRSGTRISPQGQALQPLMSEVLEAARRLRCAADAGGGPARPVRVGTVQAATGAAVAPALRDLGRRRPEVAVEVRSLDHDGLIERLGEGSIDLGLVNVMDGPSDVMDGSAADALVLRRGEAVVVAPAGHPLAMLESVAPADLLAHPFVAMRPGFLMHGLVRRLCGGELPPRSHLADGAESGMALVAEGVGPTLLPSYSVEGGALHRAGLVVLRPLAGDDVASRTQVRLELRRSPFLRSGGAAEAVAAALIAASAVSPPERP